MKHTLPLLLLCSSITVNAQDGFPDGTFGTSGIVTTSFASGSVDQASDIAIQTDGKIVGAGYSIDPNTALECFSLARYNTNGSLDNSFGTSGKVITTIIPGFNCSAYAVDIQTDGKILVAGHANDTNATTPQDGYFVVARYLTNGTLDSTFDADGIAIVQIQGTDPNVMVTDMLLQPDSHIVVCGGAYINMVDGDMVFIRLTTSGALDNNFGASGISVQAPPAGGATPIAIALQPDNRIVAAGFIDAGNHNDPFMTRLNDDGTIDSNFGSAGFIFPTYGFSSGFLGVALQQDGKIIACGFADAGAILARFYDDGLPDASFGTSGALTVPIGTQMDAMFEDVSVQSDKKIVAGGSADGNFALIRTDSLGALDAGFGTGGITQTSIPISIIAQSAALELQTDGKIVLAGFAATINPNTPSVYALVRYNNTVITSIAPAEETVFHLFPNPATDNFTFNANEPGAMELYDANGRIVLSRAINSDQTQISLLGIAAGTYVVRFTGESGVVLNSKLIIQQ